LSQRALPEYTSSAPHWNWKKGVVIVEYQHQTVTEPILKEMFFHLDVECKRSKMSKVGFFYRIKEAIIEGIYKKS
jgi:hypothetical protein